jgi:hypothetical protein
MNDNKISWYSMTRELALQEHESVAFNRAIEIVDDYIARSSQQFQTGEDAIAATMFGFSRSTQEFIEICVHGPSKISYKFESPDKSVAWFLKPWRGIFSHQEDLRSREELVQRVEEFFLQAPNEILQRIKRQK